MEDGSRNLARLEAENMRLKKALKELTVEKNMMQYRLLRAFHKLLNTKKRKVKRLERSLRRLRREDDEGLPDVDDDDNNHCDTCQCRKKRGGRRRVAREGANGVVYEETGDSDATVDRGSEYGSDTEVDEEQPSNNDLLRNVDANLPTTGTVARLASTVVKNAEPSTSGIQSSSVTTAKGGEVEKVAKGKASIQLENNDESQLSQSIMSSQPSDYEIDDLVDELCS